MKVLLLAGTAEARAVAAALAVRDIAVIASLAGATRSPATLPVPTRIGGFGGQAGFEAFLDTEKIDAVLDATHPFAARITARTAMVCAARGLPCAHLIRPASTPGKGDDWTMVTQEEDVAAQIPASATVFLATGRQSLPRFAALAGHRVILRVVDPPRTPFPFPGGEFLIARPPFTAESERHLFNALGIDVVVAKNAGGAEGRAKLDAARALRLPVVMIRRPAPPDGTILTSVNDALDWLAGL
ncbi:MAG: cobalt-precorrin-6A reductase [Limimaricola sp.]|uniref:cobalt-precorrin-6A reductase n=1 Tax=Limimaricola sp. TaxID=2211665 RepID=UPI001DF3EC99|nr:cobalt-precorrin-6A reductase [Limimaricola sp.]MBI1418233.1 cobalt-precorrin-6A reductase [Limimaricola sp.]